MASIKKIVLSGFFWSIINQMSITLTGLVISGVLSRLVSPSEYGIVAMVTLSTGFLNVIKDFGFGAALVQKKVVSDAEYSTVFWFNMIIGASLTLLVYAAAPYIGAFFREPMVERVMKALSFTFTLNSIGIIWSNKLTKRVAFKQIFYRNFVATLIAGICAVILAFQGFGVWVLVSQIYISMTVNSFLNFVQVRWLPTFTMKKVYIKDLIRFGLPLLADQSINYWARNIDNLLVGRMLGKDTLAYYSKAYNLMLLPVKQLTTTLTKVLFPSFSMIQDNKAQIAQIYLKISGVVAFIAFPMMICLSLLAEPLILIVYGNNWRQVIPIFKILSILGMFQSLLAMSGNIYLSLGKTKMMFKIGLFSRTTVIAGLVTGLYLHGIMGMVYGYCMASGSVFFPELYFIGKLINLSLKTIILNFIPYLLLASCCYICVRLGFHRLHLPLVLDFIVQGLCFGSLYLLLNYLFKTKAFTNIYTLVKERKTMTNI
ncbi:lipopolysaccharide biosynthesis protein [Pedobacter sp.]|uniref:lipopolysaccharide biosynthesis protein n=1 Tax=Pedobacter sp. TaxID=1411316 RepID=UPI003D7F2953